MRCFASRKPRISVETDLGAPQLYFGGSASAWTQAFQNDRISARAQARRVSDDDDNLLVC